MIEENQYLQSKIKENKYSTKGPLADLFVDRNRFGFNSSDIAAAENSSLRLEEKYSRIEESIEKKNSKDRMYNLNYQEEAKAFKESISELKNALIKKSSNSHSLIKTLNESQDNKFLGESNKEN